MENPNKFCIDATPLENHHSYRGIGRYVAGLLSGIEKVGSPQTPPLQLLTLGRKSAASLSFWPHRSLPPRVHWPFNRWLLIPFLKSKGVKVFHATDPGNIPVGKGVATLATAHDLIPWIFKEDYIQNAAWDRKLFFENILRGYRRADHIVAISEATKRDFVQMLGIDPKKISVIYQGYDEELFIIKESDPVSLRAFPKKFFLYAGGFDSRKNVAGLLSAYSAAKARTGEKLVLVGKMMPSEERDIRSQVLTLGIADEVVMPGYVADPLLVDLYNAATAFVFPSKYEGFGLPLLEAMACGCPIISTWASSIPEIAQDAAILVEPSDIPSLAKALEDLSSDETKRAELKAKGMKRLKDFNWRTCARQTLNLYNKLS